MIQRIGPMTIAQYERLIEGGEFERTAERVELIRGELRYMSPAGPFHDGILFFLTNWCGGIASSDQYGLGVQIGVTFESTKSIPEPDIAVMRKRNFRRRRPTAEDIVLLIEVSDSSLEYDRHEKAQLYAEAGVAEYWIVNCLDQCLEVHRTPTAGHFAEKFKVSCGGVLYPLFAPKAVLNVSDVFADDE